MLKMALKRAAAYDRFRGAGYAIVSIVPGSGVFNCIFVLNLYLISVLQDGSARACALGLEESP